MVLEYVEKNQSKLWGMSAIACEAINEWMLPLHECAVGTCVS
jgi:hypothetical protein